MANFLFIYRGGDQDVQNYSPEQIQQYMQMWMDWINQGFAAGWMVDPGDALHVDADVDPHAPSSGTPVGPVRAVSPIQTCPSANRSAFQIGARAFVSSIA